MAGGKHGKLQPVDLSHHINAKSKARHPSPLKDIIRFMGQEGMISLAGGLPHPSLFPLERAKFDVLSPSALNSSHTEGGRAAGLSTLDLGRGDSSNGLDLTRFLQYGSGCGDREVIELATELTERVHSPPAAYECLLHPGNTNAWSKVVGLLCEDNDYVVVDEFTYPSAQALWIPVGIRAAPVQADADGLSATGLRDLLENWDESGRGARRPRVYHILHLVDQDLIIVEDDPYYFLQYPPYTPAPDRAAPQTQTTTEFLSALTPSFTSIDSQGRVIRLESFSKTVFPGLRLGYFIANPVFTERLLRATEVETQDPAGLSQAFVLALFQQWGMDGYFTWLQNLQCQYRQRRDWLLDAFHEHFAVVPASESPVPSSQGLVVCIPGKAGGTALRPVFRFVEPGAGMFVWSTFLFEDVRRFQQIKQSASQEDPEQAFAQELWMAMADDLVLLTPGSYYHPWQGADMVTTKARGAAPDSAHFRFSFASPTEEQIHEGVRRMRKVIERYWGAEAADF
ncbi:hypothetical protein LTR65_005740 [Meristemomyces frigidus]